MQEPCSQTIVVWCGEFQPTAAAGFEVRGTDAENVQSASGDVVLLDAATFADVGDCRDVCQSIRRPVLLLVDRQQLVDVLAWIDEKDDVCLRESPWSMIAHRLSILVRSHRATLDPLTGVHSRKHLMEYVQQAASEASAESPLSAILIDIDHFKALNDRHGHGIGDKVLIELGGLLRAECPEHFVARLGGEEFAILARVDPEPAFEIADRIRRAAEQYRFVDELSITLSVGAATLAEPGDSHLLLSQADEAVYAAKAQGRNRTLSFDDVRSASLAAGDDIEVISLENKARVFSERVTSFITRRSRRLLENLRNEADTDGLTQVYTRRYLDRRLAADLELFAREDRRLAVALVDVDHFGQVNKTHGWPTGDKVLKAVCGLILDHVRNTDWVGRYGGEEFCLVMPDTPLDGAILVLERLRETVAGHVFRTTSGQPLNVTMSIGVVEFEPGDTGPEMLLERASVQTLAAKNSGRNCLRFENREESVA